MNAWKEGRTKSPFESLNFLSNAQDFLKTTMNLNDFTDLNQLLSLFKALTTHLLSTTFGKLQKLLKNGMDDFTAKNENQFFSARTLSLVFIQMTMLDRFVKYAEDQFEGM